ncbi:MAG TPA: hypothetical protein PLT68_08980 [Actinomycetota bacterium]|nr:hypothetical protein [Actinomycetota bacterium]
MARIVPAHPTPLDQLRASGKAQPAEGSLADLLAKAPLTVPGDSAAELDQMRAER